jgi:hypothetical protein
MHLLLNPSGLPSLRKKMFLSLEDNGDPLTDIYLFLHYNQQ